MAERRMFTKKIIDSDAFLDMPLSAQALYFHLSMRADDDGFVGNPKRIQRLINASEDDLKLLIAKRFILIFDSGIIVIKHWNMHNYIRKDRYVETSYQDEKKMIETKDNGSYTFIKSLGQPNDNQNVDTRIAEVRLGKVSIGKDNKTDVKSKDLPLGFNSIITDFTKDEKLRKALYDYRDMRVGMKKGFTSKALILNLKKLIKLSDDPYIQTKIVEQSIERSWTALFPLKNIKEIEMNEPSDDQDDDDGETIEEIREKLKKKWGTKEPTEEDKERVEDLRKRILEKVTIMKEQEKNQ